MKDFKKFIAILLISCFFATCVVVCINIIVDPFGVFGDNVINWDSYNICNNPRIGKKTYIDKNHEKYNSYIVGGSKSSYLTPSILDDYYNDGSKFYNMMMYSGNFYDYNQTIQYLINNYEVKRIILHMSGRELNLGKPSAPSINDELPAGVNSERSSFEYYTKFLFLDIKHSIQKLDGLTRRYYDPYEYGYIFAESGVYDRTGKDELVTVDYQTFLNENPNFKNPLPAQEADAVPFTISELSKIKKHCDEHNVELTFIIGATYDHEIAQYSPEDFDNFLLQVAEITDFWNFFEYTEIGLDARNFYDEVHPKTFVGTTILAKIFNDETVLIPDDFGTFVTQENVSDYVNSRRKSPVETELQ